MSEAYQFRTKGNKPMRIGHTLGSYRQPLGVAAWGAAKRYMVVYFNSQGSTVLNSSSACGWELTWSSWSGARFRIDGEPERKRMKMIDG